MTFDDGIVKIYSVENNASKGNKPSVMTTYKSSFHFGYDDVGIQRYYSAMSNNQLIECVINIDYDRTIKPYDLVVFEDESVFVIDMVQHPTDEDGLRYTRLSLERAKDEYNFKTDNG